MRAGLPGASAQTCVGDDFLFHLWVVAEPWMMEDLLKCLCCCSARCHSSQSCDYVQIAQLSLRVNSPQPGSYPVCGLLSTNPSSLVLPNSWFWPAYLADRQQKKLSHVNSFLMDLCVLSIAAINLAKLKLFRHYYVMVSKTPAHMHVGSLEAVQKACDGILVGNYCS